VRALASIRDPRSLDLLEHALATDIAPSVRRSAARGLADLNLIYPEESSKLNRCLLALLAAIKDDEWVVRYSAIFGIELHLLKYNSINKHQCIMGLKQLSSNSESIKVIRLRATLALQRVNPS
jgi:phycocyanobilin lyase beta subunit